MTTQKQLDDLFARGVVMLNSTRDDLIAWLGEYNADLSEEQIVWCADKLIREWNNFNSREVLSEVERIVNYAELGLAQLPGMEWDSARCMYRPVGTS